jgi:predicted DCC family thiol-disulfide oxidoreductase YuxK
MNDACPTVYYDGSCPLCRAEIAQYRRAGGDVAYADVSEGELPEGLSREAAMARFHYRAGDGRLLSGAAAFAALWLELTEDRPRLRPLARLANTRPALLVGEALYRAFLPVRPIFQRAMRVRERRHARG